MSNRPSHAEFLNRLAVEQRGHSGGSLLAHLTAVRDILVRWGGRTELAIAGLYHSVYGTESYQRVSLDPSLRDLLREQIGTEAERLVFCFGAMRKQSFYDNLTGDNTGPHTIQCRLSDATYTLSEQEFADLCELTVANWLEQRPRAPLERRLVRPEEFRAMQPWLSAGAWEALAIAYGFDGAPGENTGSIQTDRSS